MRPPLAPSNFATGRALAGRLHAAAWFAGSILICSTAAAQVTSTVVDLPVPSSTIPLRYLDVRPAAPVATIVVLVAGQGQLGLQGDGTMTTLESKCSPVIRNRAEFAAHGYALVLVDDVFRATLTATQALVDHLRQLADVPIWINGGSASSPAAATLAANLPAALPLGLTLYSPDPIDAAVGASIKRPSLVVYHTGDTSARPAQVLAALTAAPVKVGKPLTGGANTGCNGFHTFMGLDAEFVGAMTEFIDKYNGTLDADPAVSTAIEYYNAGLDHYFLTHVAAEAAVLDAGATIKGWSRTGQSFSVYASGRAGASPVCRFYIPPGKGDSHFYGRGTEECGATGRNNPSFIDEDPQFFHVVLPTLGTCPAATRPVYRVFSNRPDANHRYMVERALRDQMSGNGWLIEGDSADFVVMCSPL
jgi:hypothetical protein